MGSEAIRVRGAPGGRLIPRPGRRVISKPRGSRQLNVQIDANQLKARTERQTKHLVYSVSDALNQTALAIQTAERVNLDRRFTIRQAGFIYRLIKIKPFASPRQGRPCVEIFVDQKPRVLLGLFEAAGTKQPAKGASVAVPITGEAAARPAF